MKIKFTTQNSCLPSLMCVVTRSQHFHFQLENKKKSYIDSVTITGHYDYRYMTGNRRLRTR